MRIASDDRQCPVSSTGEKGFTRYGTISWAVCPLGVGRHKLGALLGLGSGTESSKKSKMHYRARCLIGRPAPTQHYDRAGNVYVVKSQQSKFHLPGRLRVSAAMVHRSLYDPAAAGVPWAKAVMRKDKSRSLGGRTAKVESRTRLKLGSVRQARQGLVRKKP